MVGEKKLTEVLDYTLISEVLAEYCFLFQEKTDRRDRIVKQVDIIKRMD